MNKVMQTDPCFSGLRLITERTLLSRARRSYRRHLLLLGGLLLLLLRLLLRRLFHSPPAVCIKPACGSGNVRVGRHMLCVVMVLLCVVFNVARLLCGPHRRGKQELAEARHSPAASRPARRDGGLRAGVPVDGLLYAVQAEKSERRGQVHSWCAGRGLQSVDGEQSTLAHVTWASKGDGSAWPACRRECVGQ